MTPSVAITDDTYDYWQPLVVNNESVSWGETDSFTVIPSHAMPAGITSAGLFNEMDLPVIYKIAQSAFGRDFRQLSVMGVRVRTSVKPIRIRAFKERLGNDILDSSRFQGYN